MNNKEPQTESRPVNNPIAGTKRNPYTVWFVVLAFIAPVALAYITFFFVDVKSYINHGEILDPIINITDLKLKDEEGNLIPGEKLTYKWRLISFIGKNCNPQCESRLYDTRQIHTSLGKDQHRLIRMFVHLQPASNALNTLISEAHQGVTQTYGDSDEISKAFGKNIRENAGITGDETYIMDPMGNIMMRFTKDQPNKEFLYDLKKLLKASQIG